ncbi:MAG: hydrogenase formation protein HypD [Proteobacteria bacterium]|nr:hydrogenase formation protein HypD [Pseudomonadota bacterium]
MEIAESLKLLHSRDHVAVLRDQISVICKDSGPIKLMHICGTHEHEIVKYGVRQLLPNNIRIIPGPGCPVCICPVEAIDQAVKLSHQTGVTVLTFGDMIRVPATRASLEDARRTGGDVKMVYGPMDAVTLALENPDRKYVFFSVGFETTTFGVASLLKNGCPKNLFFLMANRYMPPILELLMDVHDESIQGFMLPGHAVTITGIEPYKFMEKEFGFPCVVTGFEPVDLLVGIRDLLVQIKQGEARVTNAYKRVVNDEGNLIALEILAEVFDIKAGIWRGIDRVENSAYILKDAYSDFDALKQFDCDPGYPPQPHPPGCECHRIMLGELQPTDCKMFRSHCTPSKPYGPCMVSTEGTCRTWYAHGSGEL